MSSCSKNTHETLDAELLNEPLTFNTLSIKDVTEIIGNIDMDELVSYDMTRSTESLVNKEIKPLIDNGIAIHSEILLAIDTNNLWGDFTTDEIDEIQNFDDAQYIALSLIITDNGLAASNAPAAKEIVKCLGYALIGIGSADAYISGTVELITVKTAVQIVETLAKRAIGFVGAVWAVYDFIDCINSL